MASTISAGTTTGTAIAVAGDTTGNLAFQTNGTTTAMTIDTSQNVGIGTASPSNRLDVSGNAGVTGNLLFNSGYGSAVIGYGCRAWVNFNGTSTPAIRASGNVTSITDNGAGLYTVNMTTAMPDVDYTINVSTGGSSFTNLSSINSNASAIIAPTTSAFRIYSYSRGSATASDADYVNVSVFR
jgi:hypothetical protein